MHRPSVSQLVYNALFPHPRPCDPPSFPAHIVWNLVPEVRIETSIFYGTLDYVEAQYPGLDYTHKPHRMRLSRFTWHRRLFRVFDQLRLTESEISSLCRWEGTKSARERYERETGDKVVDTTACDIRPASPARPPFVEVYSPDGSARVTTIAAAPDIRQHSDDSDDEQQADDDSRKSYDNEAGYSEQYDSEETEDSSDEELESYGVELNNRLITASAARARGADVPLDNAWEQWMKEVVERRDYSRSMNAMRTSF